MPSMDRDADAPTASRPDGAPALRGQEGHRRPGPPARADDRRAPGPRPPPRRGRARAWPRRWPSRRSPTSIGGDFKRIQFTPDLVPADLVGTRIYNQKTGEFTTSLGPVFTNLLLADEINRAPGQGPERPARGDAGAPGHDRPRDPPGARPVPRAGDPEPDRDRGHVRRCPRRRSTGSCSRSSSATRRRPRSSSSSSARPSRVGGGPAGPLDRRPARRSSGEVDRGVRRPGPASSTPSGCRPRRARRGPTGCPSSSATSPTARARAPRST